MNHSVFANAIDIRLWLQTDSRTPEQERVTRDRSIGRSLTQDPDTPKFKRVLGWWRAISAETGFADGLVLPGQNLAALVRLATTLLLLLGLVLGVSIAGVAFSYQGSYPVNLFALLGILVGLPLVMLAFSLLLLQIKLLVPVSIRDATAVLSPGRWVGSWLEHRIPVGLFESISSQPIQGNFARWQLLAFSQSFAIGYFLGVIAVAWLLIMFTDLAFGWSTTLEVEAESVWRGLGAVSLPWSGWLPIAVPDLALVEASRFFRLEDHAIDASRAAALGGWWPFVLMFITVYGLLPRVLLALIAKWQLHKARRQLLEEGSEITALLDRLGTPSVTFEGPSSEDSVADPGNLPGVTSFDIDAGSRLIIWNNVLSTEQFTQWIANRAPGEHTPILAAEWQTIEDQRQALEEIRPVPTRIIILTKGWEPPLLAFTDYLVLLRSVIGPAPVIVVVPLDITASGVKPADREVWARALAGGDDPRLYVVGANL